MRDHNATFEDCPARRAITPQQRERGVAIVILLTATMMVLEIAVGYATNSMALIADGWHMATHVGALGLTSVGYWVSRRFAGHRSFAFGTGKVRALAGYTSAIALGLVAIAMGVESVERLFRPHAIDFVRSLPVAFLGLIVNLASVYLLHDAHDHEHEHDHDHDHSHRAAFMHVVADAFTSALAIAALLAGRFWNWGWLDAVTGLVGGLVILHWSAGLSRNAALELLDVAPSSALEDEVRAVLEALDGVRVVDLHVWSLGGHTQGCIVTLVTSEPRDVRTYRAALAHLSIAHLTIEVRPLDPS